MKMTIKYAESVTGDLSSPSKMPGRSYNLPADRCRTGFLLHKDPSSICFKCYARGGRYCFPNCKNKMGGRLESIYHPDWVPAMALLIDEQSRPYFRWHDSGDLHSFVHLMRIIKVVELTPEVKHWLPSKEYALINRYIRERPPFPDNLNVRISIPYVNLKDTDTVEILNNRIEIPKESVTYSFAFTPDKVSEGEAPGYICRAKGECGDCRACWNPKVKHVTYPFRGRGGA